MEIRFIPNIYSEDLSSEGIDAIPPGILNDIFSELAENNTPIEFKELNYGPGADWIWLYALLTGITHLIILGGQINSGFEGWASLAKKILNIKNKCSHIALDKDAITALCVYKITELEPNTEIIKKVIEYETEVPAGYGTIQKGTISDFIQKARIFYVQGFEVNSKLFVLLCSNIEGDIEIVKQIEISC